MRRLLFQQASVNRHQATGLDKYGNAINSVAVLGPFVCRLEESSSAEKLDDRDAVMTSAVLYLMPEADIRSDDTVTVDAKTYRVNGDPIRRSGFNSLHHLEVKVMEVRP
jgi:hypothetical protein